MKHLHIVILTSLISALSTVLAPAQSAVEIMGKVDDVLRNSYSTTAQSIKLITGKYVVKDQTMKFSEKPRVKVIQSVEKKGYGDNKRDSRSIALILEPINDKGIGTLTYDYDDADKDADLWIYLPALGKIKRLQTSKENNDESGSFFGSEFSIEDLEIKKVHEFTYKILREETYNQRPVWVIESIPTEKKAKKSRYAKVVSWIDKERHLVLRDDLYNSQGNICKQLTRGNIELVDNVWLAKKVTMNNLLTSRVTLMELISVAFNMPIPDEFLTQRTLTDFSFKEKNLTAISKFQN